MTQAGQIYQELLQTTRLAGAAHVRYRRWYGTLERVCIERSADFRSEYATLFSRLLAVCRAAGVDHRPADRFRRHARLVLKGEKTPTKEEETADLADLCHFVRQIYGGEIPAGLPAHIRPIRPKEQKAVRSRDIRAVVTKVLSPGSFECLPDGDDIRYRVRLKARREDGGEPLPLTRYLYEGANVMLLDAETADEEAGCIEVYMAVLEPDCLIDVSALTHAIKPYGESPLNYLLDRFEKKLPSKYTLLGEMANAFMDDCINEPDTQERYAKSLKKDFKRHVLDYACLSNEELGADFFKKTALHFEHIRDTVSNRFPAEDVGIRPEDVLLEPSFICPALGLRGRLDVMTKDFTRVLELKSGKADEFMGRVSAAKPDHVMQMTLYGEILRRNFRIDWNALQTYLFYSVYPLLLHQRPSAAAIRGTLHLRNGIVCLSKYIRDGQFGRILPRLTPENLNERKLGGIFYTNYLLPGMEATTRPLQRLAHDELLRKYFTAFLTFAERELFAGKTSDNRPDSIRGFAATWTADLRTKLLAGNILTGLTLEKAEAEDNEGISTLLFRLPAYDGDFIPNFSEGEMVQVYEADSPEANVTNRQLLRGIVKRISTDTLTVELAYKQRNLTLFSRTTRYAVEHDSTDGPSAQQIRNLFSLLTASPSRRDLLLARRPPAADPSRRLLGQYDGNVSAIVERAKQAKDYFLLVGPPGTGKTNLALRAMVKEFLLTIRTEGFRSLLLTAYTNRAVDEICSMLGSLSEEIAFDFLRIGSPQTCDPKHHSHLLCKRAETLENREEARRLIDSVPVVAGTVTTLTGNQILFRRKRFAAAIIDEASQLLEPQLLGLLCAHEEGEEAVGKFILIGDHKQLPAVVLQPESHTRVTDETLRSICLTDLRNSLFERLHSIEQAHHREAFVGMLTRQGRMHPDICDFINESFYGSSLAPVPLRHQSERLHLAGAQNDVERFVSTTRLGFVPVCQNGQAENLRANAPEAEAVAKLVEAICRLNRLNGAEHFLPSRSIGIIVPFRSQIACVRHALRRHGLTDTEELTVDTVECYQGSQRDYIIFSTTVSEPFQMQLLSTVQQVEGTPVDRKLNVAVSRARRQLFIVGNAAVLSLSPVYKALLHSCKTFEGDLS